MNRRAPFVLHNLPVDYISSINFHKTNSQLLIASSWDNRTRVYDVDRNSLKCTWRTEDPKLDSIFLGDTHIAYGGLFGELKVRDINTSVEDLIGTHDESIKSIDYIEERNILISGSWDKTIKIWDLRVQGAVETREQSNGKVYTMSIVGDKIGVGTSRNKALIWDLRQMKSYLLLHHLNYRLNCIAISPSKKFYAIGHNEGRVAVAYISRKPKYRSRKVSFRCHRMLVEDLEHIYGVDAVRFYNRNIFATGGGNGFVNVWDAKNKRHLHRYPRHEMAVTAMSFSPDRKKLAVACSEQTTQDFEYRPLAVTIKIWHVDQRKYEQPIGN